MASVQAMLYRRPALRLTGLLTPALLWLGLFYLLPLGFLLATAFFATDSFTGRVLYEFTTENVVEVLTTPAYLLTVVRTVAVAVGVTVLCVVLAVPLAAYMALVAGPRARPVLVALVVTPLWASYLVKGYAWRVLLAPEGPLGGLRLDRGGAHAHLPLAALHDPADLRGHRRHARLVRRRRGRPRRPSLDGVPHGGGAPAGPSGGGGLGVHVLAVAGRLHHRAARRRHQPDAGQHRVRELLHRPAVRGGRRAPAVAGDGGLPAHDPPHGRAGAAMTAMIAESGRIRTPVDASRQFRRSCTGRRK